MKRQPTREQKAKAEERREHLRGLWERVAALSEEERAELAAKVQTVTTCEGHELSANNTILHEWQEETEEQYYEMLGVLPPIRHKYGAFMVGECMTHSEHSKTLGGIYEAHMELDGKYFYRPEYLHRFSPGEFKDEIRAKFYGICQACGYPLDIQGFCTAPLTNDD